MAGALTAIPARIARPRPATAESPWVKGVLIFVLLVFFGLFLVLPLVVIFQEAFSQGFAFLVNTLKARTTTHSIVLTLITAAIVVPLNTFFGVSSAWALTRFEFRGRSLLTSLIDLPLWVSPVVAGLMYMLVFGRQGVLGPWIYPNSEMLQTSVIARFIYENNIKIMFALPGIVLATTFVTFPFVARSLIPLMLAQGHKEEEAAMTLGANGWQMFWRVTFPKIKWGLIYGIILTNARSMGEFGAVSVVSAHIQGKTNTMPLEIEALYNSYPNTGAFAIAALLSILALVTLIIKTYAEWQTERQLQAAAKTLE